MLSPMCSHQSLTVQVPKGVDIISYGLTYLIKLKHKLLRKEALASLFFLPFFLFLVICFSVPNSRGNTAQSLNTSHDVLA